MNFFETLWVFDQKHKVTSRQGWSKAIKLYPLILSLLPLVLISSCRHSDSTVAQEAPGVAVKLATIQTSEVAETSEYIATLESRQSVALQPRVEGLVSRILVNPGAAVKAGTPLMEIDPARQQAAVSSSAAAIASARSEVENAKATLLSHQAERLQRQAELGFMQQQHKRYTALETEGAVSRELKDQYANSLAIAEASLKATDAQIRAQQAVIDRSQRLLQQAQANTQQARVELQYYRITAPFTGTVGDIPPKVGDFVNTSTRLITVTQNNPLEVNLSIPSERAARLRLGMPIQLLNDQGQPVGTSRISFIAPNASNTTQSVLVKALYNNPNGQLRADEQVRARVIWNQRPGVLIPTTAVTRVAGENFVYLAEKAKEGAGLVARQQQVKLGQAQGNNYQVLDGLEAGERIAVTGLLQLSNGAAIVAEP
ncbi:efflux RND transporter periplasmic adaptor subunit [Leptolyngbya sp. FACHB-261]|uniref:efflux RND transporter periplasmic adaptor subunit n=1 Tax=Leptolyngbya sp. FACHB-261 TaxID=2692806 RepID=UPI001689F989|nr:efflux RND transporter periplasmic adaptor subunit [Leptolyngbya sp. FACHB-261]MBD2102473.1 efflux RND transporter periplasmic adaptor subunit [Leptolyngbya sp. FACHB-261]